jgi:uncharacterized protein YdhG (YjbR/CyaY superfamily)
LEKLPRPTARYHEVVPSDLSKEKPSMTDTEKATRTTSRTSKGFSAEERAAMREAAKEQKAATGESDVLAKIAEMPEADRVRAEKIHTLIKAVAPSLSSKTWYGMPAYAQDGTIICFYQAADKFKARYAMLGFGDKAKLDDGTMWPVYYALTELTAEDETRIAELVKKAVS